MTAPSSTPARGVPAPALPDLAPPPMDGSEKVRQLVTVLSALREHGIDHQRCTITIWPGSVTVTGPITQAQALDLVRDLVPDAPPWVCAATGRVEVFVPRRPDAGDEQP